MKKTFNSLKLHAAITGTKAGIFALNKLNNTAKKNENATIMKKDIVRMESLQVSLAAALISRDETSIGHRRLQKLLDRNQQHLAETKAVLFRLERERAHGYALAEEAVRLAKYIEQLKQERIDYIQQGGGENETPAELNKRMNYLARLDKKIIWNQSKLDNRQREVQKSIAIQQAEIFKN